MDTRIGLSGIRGNHSNDWADIKIESVCIEDDRPDHDYCFDLSGDADRLDHVRHYRFDRYGFQIGYSKQYYRDIERERAKNLHRAMIREFGF